MFLSMRKHKNVMALFVIVLVFISASLTTCDSPLGFGDSIDWEPPVLTLDKIPNPLYVKLGTTISGTVTDNVAVDRVIMRDAVSGEQLFRAVIRGDRFEIDLDFSAEQNGEKIMTEVVAYDRAGNSGDVSIASVTLIIDITPPYVENIYIQRMVSKTADLERYESLKELEGTDPNGERIANVNRYQNGWFEIKASLDEDETNITTVELLIYDIESDEPDKPLPLSLEKYSTTSYYSPTWLLKEEDIIKAGVALFGNSYETNYNNGTRYYYRVEVVGYDQSNNSSAENIVTVEQFDAFCMWKQSDDPKGFLDPLVVGSGTNLVITKGSTLPVEFFDDDQLNYAYAGLFTREQWNGEAEIGDGLKFTGGYDNDQKLAQLRGWLEGGVVVYDWKYDRYDYNTTTATSGRITNQTPNAVNERTYYVQTGNQDADYGDFVFFTLVRDQKLSPHSPAAPDLSLSIVKSRVYDVNIVDENAPLIIFDKTDGGNSYPGYSLEKGSPEENTFPALDSSEPGRAKFTIHGYTYRGQQEGAPNQVIKFRMAWIPAGANSRNPDGLIRDVRDALGAENFSAPNLSGVQWWNLDTIVTDPANQTHDTIGGNRYVVQFFQKTFDVLGGADILEPDMIPGGSYTNFNYNGARENDRKVFVFYAEDNMGHIVYSTLQLLGNTSPPTLQVFDITGAPLPLSLPPNDYSDLEIPDVYDGKYGSTTGEITGSYMAARLAYNNAAYDSLRSLAMSGSNLALGTGELSHPMQSYPKGTIVQFWAAAGSGSGDLSIASIDIRDITREIAEGATEYPKLGSDFNSSDRATSYVELFSEVDQRTILVTATDQLGNQAQVQRTVLITAAATLTSITTTEQDGTYPAGKTIQIKANFDGLIRLESIANDRLPVLNLRYGSDATSWTPYTVRAEPFTGSALALTFNFVVPQNAVGTLESIWDGINFDVNDDRPLTIPYNSEGGRIMDATLGSPAYTPGNSAGFSWKNQNGSLQDNRPDESGKNIELDGVAPTISHVIIGGKSPYDGSNYYFKDDEVITFYLYSTKYIRPNGAPELKYTIRNATESGNIAGTTTDLFSFSNQTTYTDDDTKVTYYGLIFSVSVNNVLQSPTADLRHGRLYNLHLDAVSTIQDDVGNNITTASVASAFNSYLNNDDTDNGSGVNIYIDKVKPVAPEATIRQIGGTYTTFDVPTDTTDYNVNLELKIQDPTAAHEPWLPITKQYSLDGGVSWLSYKDNEDYIGSGSHDLLVQYIDRAGNIGEPIGQKVEVNAEFPRLTSARVTQGSGTYTAGSTLEFTLNFNADVRVNSVDIVTIALADATSTTHNGDGQSNDAGNYSYQRTLTTTTAATTADEKIFTTAVTFSWTPGANTKDMLNGLKITGMNLAGLRDRYGNSAPTSISIDNPVSPGKGVITIGSNTTDYDLSGIKVSTITPRVRTYSPTNAGSATGNNYTTAVLNDNRTIELTFSKPVQKGNGTITIKPHGNYAIPSVFENDGYYLGINTDGTVVTDSNGLEIKYSSSGDGRTYVDGFYDIFNKMTSTQQGYLIGSGTMRDPQLSQQTGLSAGPYQKYYHGLSQGAGFRGNYGNSDSPSANATAENLQWQTGQNAPGPRGTDYMVPDSSNVKWVLRYDVANIYDATNNSTVTNIRSALTAAKFRWREIPVTASYVTVSADGYTVTINLSDPLLPGLQWDLYYGAGTFTDLAGNQAAAISADSYWFLSAGVQKPVIRVERRSFDARSGTNLSAGWTNATQPYNAANGYAGTIDSFLTLNYRIESETPTARLFYGTITGADNVGAATGAWTGAARLTSDTTTNANIVWGGVTNAKNSAPETIGTWVRQNLIFRNHANGAYSVYEAEGVTNSRNLGALLGTDGNVNTNRHPLGNTSTSNTNGDAKTTANIYRRYYGFRSYNKDATIGELTAVTRAAIGTTPVQTASFTYTNRLTASKNYVAAEARVDHTGATTFSATATSNVAYEGVFRTVFLLYQTEVTGADGANSVKIAATNIGSGSSTIIFPMKDGEAEDDGRTVRMLYRGTGNESGGGGTVPTNAYVFVSTEMVSQWFIQLHGNGGITRTGNNATVDEGFSSYGVGGDANDWITMGYGDLTFSMNVQTW